MATAQRRLALLCALPAASRGGMMWQGEREVMWDTVQLQATHTLALSPRRHDAAEEALFDRLRSSHEELRRRGGSGGGGEAAGASETQFVQLDNFKNTQYSGEVGIGTPAQMMRIIFDTGSANFWVYARACKSLACQLHSTYDNRLSSTYAYNGTRLHIRYGSGSVSGHLAQDTLRLGSLAPLPNQTLGEVINPSQDKAFVYGKFDGILGMAFAAIAAPGTTPVFDHLLQNGLLRAGLFSFFLPEAQRAPVVGAGGGALLLGGVDPKFASSPFLFVKLLSPAAPSYWAVRLSGVHVEHEQIAACDLPAAGIGATGGQAAGGVACRVAVDTGTSLITGPSRDVRRLLEHVRVADDCSNLAELPPVTFVVAGHTLTLSADEYVLRQQRASGVRCITGFVPLDVPPPRGPLWVFGDLFLRAYYTLFDRDQRRVGFAKARKAGGGITPVVAGDGWGQPHSGPAPQPSDTTPRPAAPAAAASAAAAPADAPADAPAAAPAYAPAAAPADAPADAPAAVPADAPADAPAEGPERSYDDAGEGEAYDDGYDGRERAHGRRLLRRRRPASRAAAAPHARSDARGGEPAPATPSEEWGDEGEAPSAPRHRRRRRRRLAQEEEEEARPPQPRRPGRRRVAQEGTEAPRHHSRRRMAQQQEEQWEEEPPPPRRTLPRGMAGARPLPEQAPPRAGAERRSAPSRRLERRGAPSDEGPEETRATPRHRLRRRRLHRRGAYSALIEL